MIPSRYVDVVFQKLPGVAEPHPATIYVYVDTEWKDLESVDPNRTRRGWAYKSTPQMEYPAWVPLHYEVTHSSDMFDGVWWLSPTTQAGPYNWTYWQKNVGDLLTYDVPNTYLLDLKSDVDFGDMGVYGNLIFPCPYSIDTLWEGNPQFSYPALFSDRPYINALYQASSPNRFWTELFSRVRPDSSYSRIFFIDRNDNFTNSDFEDFLPSGASYSGTTWILAPGAYCPAVYRKSKRAPYHGDGGYLVEPMPDIRAGGSFDSRISWYCFMTPGVSESNSNTRLDALTHSNHRILSYAQMRPPQHDSILNNADVSSSVDIVPVGGYPLDFYGAYGVWDAIDHDNGLPKSWVSAMEVISCPEDEYDIIVTVINTTDTLPLNKRISTSKISVVWIDRYNIAQSHFQNSRIFIKARWEKKLSYRISGNEFVGNRSIVLNAATLYPRSSDSPGARHGVFIGYTEVNENTHNATHSPEDIYSTTRWVCIDNPPSGGDIGQVWESDDIPFRWYTDSQETLPPTRNEQFSHILSKTIVKQTDVPGRSAALTRATNTGVWENHPWLRPYPRNEAQYAPGEARFRWVTITPGQEPTDVAMIRPESEGSQRWLVADFKFCYDSRVHPTYAQYWGGMPPQEGFDQVLIPKKTALPWDRRLNSSTNYQAAPIFSWKQTLLPGEFNNVTVYNDDRNNSNGRKGWVFACIGLRRIDGDVEMGFNELLDEDDTRDSLTLLHLEIPQLGADGIDYNVK